MLCVTNLIYIEAVCCHLDSFLKGLEIIYFRKKYEKKGKRNSSLRLTHKQKCSLLASYSING